MLKCLECGSDMRVGRRYVLHNTKFVDYLCTSCFYKITKVDALNG